MHHRIDKQLLKHNRRDLGDASAIDAASGLHLLQVPKYERERTVECALKWTTEVLRVDVRAPVNGVCRVVHRLDDKLRLVAFRLLSKEK